MRMYINKGSTDPRPADPLGLSWLSDNAQNRAPDRRVPDLPGSQGAMKALAGEEVEEATRGEREAGSI
jgi:hypothetical protein